MQHFPYKVENRFSAVNAFSYQSDSVAPKLRGDSAKAREVS